MEYMGNEKYWDDKFSSRGDNLLSPEKAIIENLVYLKKGSVLDIACGDGRNSLYLLKNGFKVTGVDFSNKAVERLRLFAKQNNYFVNTKQIDLNKANALKNIGMFDNIIINHYRLNKKQFFNYSENQDDIGFFITYIFRKIKS